MTVANIETIGSSEYLLALALKTDWVKIARGL